MVLKNDSKKQYDFLILLTLILGAVIRIIFINRFPAGLNCDEAAASFNAYSVSLNLTDKSGMFLPIYFLNIDGGQSALFTYLSVPFIKLFGLNLWGTRLPMAVVSSISVYVFYKILTIAYDENDVDYRFKVIFAVLFFTLNPWHIMKSRWGLDCNLFPDFMLYAVYFLIKYINSHKKGEVKTKYLIIGFVFLSLSSYAYATSYLALTVFCILFYIYGIKKELLTVRQILGTMLTVILLTWPLVLFIIVNFFKLRDIELIFMTIPRLKTNRLAAQSNFSIKNIISTFKLLIFQNDDIYWNGIEGIGMYYLYSFPIFVYGIISTIKDKTKNFVDEVFFIWFIAGFILCLSLNEININRANFVIIPIIYFITKGFTDLFKYRFAKIAIYALLIISFITFAYIYVDLNVKKENNIIVANLNDNKYDTFVIGLEPVIKYVDTLDARQIRLSGVGMLLDIYVMYYLKKNPLEYYRNVKYFENSYYVRQFGKWNFEAPQVLRDENGKPFLYMIKDKSIVYVYQDRYLNGVNENEFDIEKIGNYIICRYKY